MSDGLNKIKERMPKTLKILNIKRLKDGKVIVSAGSDEINAVFYMYDPEVDMACQIPWTLAYSFLESK